MKNKRILAVIILLGFIFSIGYSVNAADDIQVRSSSYGPLAGGKIKRNDNVILKPHQGFSSTTISHMNEALWAWNQHIGWSAMNRTTSTHNEFNFSNSTDSKNLIYRYSDPSSSSLAENRTYCHWLWNEVTESDIWINVSFPYSNSPRTGYYDTWTIFLHEAGHTARLGDNYSYSSAVMYYNGSLLKGSSRRSVTHSQDLNAIEYLYG